jgi:hypothetical protein
VLEHDNGLVVLHARDCRSFRQRLAGGEDLENLLRLTGFEPFRRIGDVLWPVATPIVAELANRWLAKLWPFRALALTHFVVARVAPVPRMRSPQPVVTVVVPARNEAGNVAAILDRVPEMGAGTDLVFVEGHSRDATYATIEREIAARPGCRARLYRQSGTGKGDAVRLGFAQAHGDVLMILDADLTVPPEDLPRFYEALASGRGELVNGVRLVYPMEQEAMKFFNMIANKFFSLAFTWLLGQSIKDTLCGTKVLFRADYEAIARNRAYFGDFDPFGDFDLLFGAAKLGLRIVELPVRYRETDRSRQSTRVLQRSAGNGVGEALSCRRAYPSGAGREGRKMPAQRICCRPCWRSASPAAPSDKSGGCR